MAPLSSIQDEEIEKILCTYSRQENDDILGISKLAPK